MPYLGDVGELPDAFPGWTRLEADLSGDAAHGDNIKLTAVEVMIVLGEVQRLRERLDRAARILRTVTAGNGCWAAQQGYETCAHRGVEEFLAGVPRKRLRRLWRRT